MDTIEAIKTRRSVREFLAWEMKREDIEKILEAGRFAPSGLNNQPWRFDVVTNEAKKKALAGQTHYGKIIESAPAVIVVYMDNRESYDRVKDLQAIGACIENMLLAAHDMEYGACWIGEILKNGKEVREILKAPESFELMAVVCVGHNDTSADAGEAKRKEIKELARWI